jgi:D-sedoheptulose 7-phosphate isomerase
MTEFMTQYFNEVQEIAKKMPVENVNDLVYALTAVRNGGGRVFVLGVGGSAGNASHMVNDLRKLCGIEAYAPTDNVSELTARTNDEGFETIFEGYLKVSKFNSNDAILILSVGGGNKEKNVSVGLINAIDYAKSQNGLVLGIVGKPDGYTAQVGHCVVVVPSVHPDRVTPHSEAFQAVIWHGIVSHPDLQINATKW